MKFAGFIAEVSSNHHRDIERCFAFIDKAAEIGCAAVKFQLFKISELFAPEVIARREDLRQRQAWELPVEFIPRLADRCRLNGIGFSCTPFYLGAVDQLYPFVDFYKIASYELLWHDLLRACAATGKPIVLSTGMATLAEVGEAVTVLRQSGCSDLTLLHCTSGYPTPPLECNLAAIQTMRDAFDCPVGWSDHSVSPGVVFRALYHWGTAMVDFHFDLEGEGEEFSAGHCWLPGQIGPVIASVKAGFLADGKSEKAPAPMEAQEREWRADPLDGFRPLLSERKRWRE